MIWAIIENLRIRIIWLLKNLSGDVEFYCSVHCSVLSKQHYFMQNILKPHQPNIFHTLPICISVISPKKSLLFTHQAAVLYAAFLLASSLRIYSEAMLFVTRLLQWCIAHCSIVTHPRKWRGKASCINPFSVG